MLLWFAVAAVLVFFNTPATANEFVLKDGRVLQGSMGVIDSLADITPQSDDSAALQRILFVDDQLRRIFVSRRLVQQVRPNPNPIAEEIFNIRQVVARSGQGIASVGAMMKLTPFDEFARRTYTINTTKGAIKVIQGITKLTPQYAQVEGLAAGTPSYVWDMRIATSTIPREALEKILFKLIDTNKADDYKRIARFYMQAERYEDAARILNKMVADFPNETGLKDQVKPVVASIRQLSATRTLDELKLRRDAGQHVFVYELLKKFPTEDVGGEILQGVRELIDDYDVKIARRSKIIESIDELVGKVGDPVLRKQIETIAKEIKDELRVETLDRFASFLQNLPDDQLTPEDKLAVAVSGWLIGSDNAIAQLPPALSLYKVREQIKAYLNNASKAEREQAFDGFRSEEGSSPSNVIEILARSKPFYDLPEPVAADKPGYFKLEIAGMSKEAKTTYWVQLPPEYDPYKHYPTILALHGEGDNAQNELTWWAGDWRNGQRFGQAARHGYIVVAPEWTVEHQKDYGYSAREHDVVLRCLRDACRRFSVDSDRVYLTGHSIGGDAVWDIGLAHPDLWAGVIPISASVDRYCTIYWENAKLVPFYFVLGELDGSRMVKNARDLDRYLQRGYDTTVVQYQGRGHEDYFDEILRIFEWMGRFRRNFFPREFACKSMRTWDNSFWYLEMEGMPPKAMVDPANWPPPNGTVPMSIECSISKTNAILVRCGASQVTVWLSPEMVDFKQRVSISVNGKRVNAKDSFITPDLKTILEDVRTRGDRQHPFWARFDSATGRVNAK
jgi:pimeloyl-ACP methyl ester carboxylesterase/tetratricopeptide (TPR) repeat protein